MMEFHPSKPWHEGSASLGALLDATYKRKKDAEPPRLYLGASITGKDCARAVAYQYHQTPKDPDRGFSGQLYRVFDMGHDGEERMAEYLRLAGFQLCTEDDAGHQFGYSAMDGRMQGHIDGVITGGPLLPGIGAIWPALWENKALNDKGFNETRANGVKESKPLYYAQVQIYMAYMQLERCLFTYSNRDTGEVACEVIAFDALRAQELSDLSVRIVESRDPAELPRAARDETDWRCRWCDYARTCWATTTTTERQPAPSWLNGGDRPRLLRSEGSDADE